MSQQLRLAPYCLADHRKPKRLPPLKIIARTGLASPMYLVDLKTHFTGVRGALWRLFGVTRSGRNPNICNL